MYPSPPYHVLVVGNYVQDSSWYLHRVGRAGRFGTKGMSISFVATEEDATVLKDVQSRFEGDIGELPDDIDINSYMPDQQLSQEPVAEPAAEPTSNAAIAEPQAQ